MFAATLYSTYNSLSSPLYKGKKYKDKFKIHDNVFREARKKFEREKLLSNSLKNQEIYFGINATTSYGNIISSETSISLDSETSNFNLDRILPSYKIGYKYYFKIFLRL